jgi:hypothetical protein
LKTFINIFADSELKIEMFQLSWTVLTHLLESVSPQTDDLSPHEFCLISEHPEDIASSQLFSSIQNRTHKRILALLHRIVVTRAWIGLFCPLFLSHN